MNYIMKETIKRRHPVMGASEKIKNPLSTLYKETNSRGRFLASDYLFFVHLSNTADGVWQMSLPYFHCIAFAAVE